MSVTVLRYLSCDHPGCGEMFTTDPTPNEAIVFQREEAREEGWAVSLPGGRDLCAEHRGAERNEQEG